MDITGSYTFAAPRERVWTLLLDPEALRGALPGCQEMRGIGEDEYEAIMTLGIGAVKGTYSGTIRVRDKEPQTSYRLLVEGSGRPGFVKGDGLLDLEEQGETTVVTYQGQVQVGGTIASVGQRLLSATVGLVTNQFFKAMERQLGREPMRVSLTINGTKHSHEVEARLLLVNYLRDLAGLTGTHIGCDTSQCGACTVLLDGQAVKSCTLLAVQADGAEVVTIEGMAGAGTLHPLQEGFWEQHGLQCGYCTPGMIMAAYALLQRHPHPSEDQIRHGIEGNICRCTGYQAIVASITWAAEHGGTAPPAAAAGQPAAAAGQVRA